MLKELARLAKTAFVVPDPHTPEDDLPFEEKLTKIAGEMRWDSHKLAAFRADLRRQQRQFDQSRIAWLGYIYYMDQAEAFEKTGKGIY